MSLLTVEQASHLDIIQLLSAFSIVHTEHSRLREGELNLTAFRHKLWQEVSVTTLMGELDERVRSACESFVESEIDGSRIPRNAAISTVIKHNTYMFVAISIGLIFKKFDNVTMYRNGQNYFIVGPDYTTVIHQADYDFSDVGLSKTELDEALDKVIHNSVEMTLCYGDTFVQNMYTYLDVEYTGLDAKTQLDEDALASALDYLSNEKIDTTDLRFIKTGVSSHFFNPNIIISYCPSGHVASSTVWPTNFKDAFDA